MKKIILLISILFFGACTTLKSTQKDINSGNYKTAMFDAISKIRKDKNSEKSKAYASLLYEAYHKYKSQKLRDISFMKNDSHLSHAKSIYESYKEIKYIQDQIRPLLPLKSAKGETLNFKLSNYSDHIINSKNTYADHLFSEALNLIEKNTRKSYRDAYQRLQQVKALKPNYNQLQEMLDIAYQNGISYVLISSVNHTDILLPKSFKEEILNIDTYHLDDFWTIYHNQPKQDLDYDQEVIVELNAFSFSPERLREREIALEREIIEGWEYKKDRRGNFILDENGHKIKQEIFSTVSGILLEAVQNKEVQVLATVKIIDLYKNEQIKSQNLESLFVFENKFAQFKGDPRVLQPKEQLLIKRGFVNFPSNEKMLLDAVDDVKNKIKTILKKHF